MTFAISVKHHLEQDQVCLIHENEVLLDVKHCSVDLFLHCFVHKQQENDLQEMIEDDLLSQAFPMYPVEQTHT